MKTKLILFPTDGSKSAEKALDYAAELALNAHAKLIVLHVQQKHGLDAIPPDLQELERVEHIQLTEAEVLRGAAETVAARVEHAARAKGAPETERMVVEGDPAEQILKVAKARKADTIVMGSRGLGDLKGLLLGSVSHKVAQLAPCTCIIVR